MSATDTMRLLREVLEAAPGGPLKSPDGRRLVRYGLSESAFARIATLLDEERAWRDRHELARRPDKGRLAALFTLYAAESWRRRYDGGAWTWDCVPLASSLAPLDRTALVEAGLAHWKRPVFQGKRREYLGTVAAEAGIPSALLKRDGTRLRGFLRALLEDFASYPQTGTSAERLAWDQRLRAFPGGSLILKTSRRPSCLIFLALIS